MHRWVLCTCGYFNLPALIISSDFVSLVLFFLLQFQLVLMLFYCSWLQQHILITRNFLAGFNFFLAFFFGRHNQKSLLMQIDITQQIEHKCMLKRRSQVQQNDHQVSISLHSKMTNQQMDIDKSTNWQIDNDESTNGHWQIDTLTNRHKKLYELTQRQMQTYKKAWWNMTKWQIEFDKWQIKTDKLTS